MSNTANLRFKDPAQPPTSEMLAQTLGESYAAYEALQEALPNLDMEQAWQWYTPYKAWFAKGQHFYTTPRGAHKEKTLYWLYVYDGYFSVAVWFKEKNRLNVCLADVSEKTRTLIHNAETAGKMPTFPVVFDIPTGELPLDIFALVNLKKRLEV